MSEDSQVHIRGPRQRGTEDPAIHHMREASGEGALHLQPDPHVIAAPADV